MRVENTETICREITKAPGRKLLYHFTRARNLPSIYRTDSLSSSFRLAPEFADGNRRTASIIVRQSADEATLNPHLHIPVNMMEDGCSPEQFRAYLDRHVFLWPTASDCRKMLETYTRREPQERFVVLALDAFSLLRNHYANAKLSKYDSGSAPRFPHLCTYRKSPAMFLPLLQFNENARRNKTPGNVLPSVPSQIKEVLIENKVSQLSAYLRAIYIADDRAIPEEWRSLAETLSGF
jgi:hypothetical protein